VRAAHNSSETGESQPVPGAARGFFPAKSIPFVGFLPFFRFLAMLNGLPTLSGQSCAVW
jgi:hypothetical protein